ncbi:hypothetical protein EDD17DRAFT_1893988 [Pisolithus thermaeus]|nr:hypothetical protein EV401DRAFT_2203911 [Pisolithus croceorrhizus]KAI6166285.1 hypothetical protein EDD17DRAFT_1893988 [Pisolithus thermaeus]
MATVQVAEAELPFFKFPPFPRPPEGAIIVSFKDFKPRGIQLFTQMKRSIDRDDDEDDEDAEVDGLGVPTVELRVKHASDECKSNKAKKRMKKKKGEPIPANVPVKKLPWYEEWEEGEDLRVTKNLYDRSIPPTDRLFQAALDFRAGRPWPPAASGLNNIWDQFRLYIGLLVNPTTYKKGGDKKAPRDASPDSDSEDESDGEFPEIVSTCVKVQGTSKKRPRPRDPSSSAVENGDEDEDVPFDQQKIDEETKEEKLSAFLSDPEKSVRIFLSSHMREKGLIWSERNLTFAPHLLSFFLRFVLRNRVLPEQTYQRGVKRALGTIELAKKELPLTYKIGHMLPDKCNEGCQGVFGRMGTVNWFTATVPEEQPKESSGEPSKLQVTDIATGERRDITLPSEKETTLKEAIEDNLDMDVTSQLEQGSAETGWGGWGNTDSATEGNAWGSEWGGWDTGGGQGASWDVNTESMPVDGDQECSGPLPIWSDSAPTWGRDLTSLMTFLGPSVFPLTHTTGIVECSTRRIREVIPPAPSSPTSAGKRKPKHGRVQDTWAPAASGVEAELDARFAKVILAPWDRFGGDISEPEIWATSRGPVIDPNVSVDSQNTDAGSGKQIPHDPLTDDVTLLVEPHLLDTLGLVPGLGLGAMWVQLVRMDDMDGEAVDGPPRTTRPKTFWYHEDLTGIFPSFYTPGSSE